MTKIWQSGLAGLALAMAAAPAMAAEQAVVIKPSDTATVRICFRLASIAFMESETRKWSEAEDMAAGEEPIPDLYDEEPREEGMPSDRAVFLGWEKAFAADQAARGLTEEQAELDAVEAWKATEAALMGDRRGDYEEQKATCKALLSVQKVDGQWVAEMTPALDPADMTDYRFAPDSPMIDDKTLLMCMARADGGRMLVGAAVLGDEARFHRLLRERHPDSYEQAVIGATSSSLVRLSKDMPNIESDEDPEVMVARFKAARAEEAALCHKHR